MTPTPEEKAKIIYDFFYDTIESVQAVDGGGWSNCTLIEKSVEEVAKECALICVEELIKSCSQFGDIYDQVYFDSETVYWQKVKEALTKI